MRISRHPLTSFLMGLKTTKTRIVIHCDYITCASIVERMHPSFVQVVPFCLHEIRPASGNKYTDHWPNSPILEVCPKVVEHSLVKAKAKAKACVNNPKTFTTLPFEIHIYKHIAFDKDRNQSMLPTLSF